MSLTSEWLENYAYKNLILKLRQVSDLDYEPTTRYLHLMDTCPITLEPINIPAILSDGVVYELSAIKHILKTSNINPLTGEKLSGKSHIVHCQGNNAPEQLEQSIKMLYLPVTDEILYFDFV